MRLLLTGFGPFRNVVENPSGRLARLFAARGIPGVELTAEELPVSYDRAGDRVTELLSSGDFDAAILLGVAAASGEIRLEAMARNSADGDDCDGKAPPSDPAEGEGPPSITCRLDLGRVAACLRVESIPVAVSEDAGAYVCNHTYYAALRASPAATHCLFVHLPPDEKTLGGPTANVLALDEQARAVELIVHALEEQIC